MNIDTCEVHRIVERLKKSINTDNGLITKAMLLAYDSIEDAIKLYEKIEGKKIATYYKEEK